MQAEEQMNHRPMRRSSMDVMYAMLTAIHNGPLGITQIFYRSNTTFQIAMQNIKWMMSKGLLMKDPVLPVYSLTQKGLDAVNAWYEVMDAIGITEESRWTV